MAGQAAYMADMTSTSTLFREENVTRDAAGKFAGPAHTAPEVAFGDTFELATFLQEPPTEPEPFTTLQPVIYTTVDGEDAYGTVMGVTEHGWLDIVDRTPGTLGDTGDERTLVEPRYVRPDDDLPPGAALRQSTALDAALTCARNLTDLNDAERGGMDSYQDSLEVRDALRVDGRSDWVREDLRVRNTVDRGLLDLARRDLLSWDALGWPNVETSDAPDEFHRLSDAFGHNGWVTAQAEASATMLASYGDWAHIDEDTLSDALAAGRTARELGVRMSASTDAAGQVDAEVDAVGADAAERVFGGHVGTLPDAQATAYRDAASAASTAFDALDRSDLLGFDQRIWLTRYAADERSEHERLIRAAGQAAILRHFQPETGLTDEQLNAISDVFDGAVRSWSAEPAA